jgi:glycosyltransferase involved in cell wall biosynthesis
LIKVGFWYDYGIAYAAGFNYFKNLLFAIDKAKSDRIQTILFIGKDLPKDDEDELNAITQVVKVNLLTHGTPAWFFHRILSRLGSQYLVERILKHHGISVISHPSMIEKIAADVKLISWIPDFQYLHLPQYFPGKYLADRNEKLRKIYDSSDAVIVSSQDGRKDLVSVLKNANLKKVHVLPFVAQIKKNDTAALDDLLSQYKLPEKYFFLPNQFWAHKNHVIAFRAVAALKTAKVDVKLVCSGWMFDPTNNKNSNDLIDYVKDQGLQENIYLLGKIPYAHVIELMRASVAVINPSLFEGWSTSVEEAKSLGKPLIASNIAVHIEQNHPAVHYFDPNSVDELVDCMGRAWQLPHGISEVAENLAESDLKSRTLQFGQRYLVVLDEVLPAEKPTCARTIFAQME